MAVIAALIFNHPLLALFCSCAPGELLHGALPLHVICSTPPQDWWWGSRSASAGAPGEVPYLPLAAGFMWDSGYGQLAEVHSRNGTARSGRRLGSEHGKGKWYDVPEDMEIPYTCESSLSSGVCPTDYELDNNKCYKYSGKATCKKFADARTECQNDGADLVSIDNQAENDFVTTLSGISWIGLQRHGSNTWKWVESNNVATWTSWAEEEPNDYDDREDNAFIGGFDSEEMGDQFPECWEYMKMAWLWEMLVPLLFLFFFLLIVFTECCVAMCYKQKVTSHRPAFPGDAATGPLSMAQFPDFRFPFCSCKEDCQTCMHGWCLFPIRISDSAAASGVGQFWSVFSVYILALFVGIVVDILYAKALEAVGVAAMRMSQDLNARQWLTGLIVALYMYPKRQALKAKFGHPNPKSSCFNDFCLWWCCSCCAAIQEARQIDAVQGVTVFCCCKLVTQSQPTHAWGGAPPGATVVGQPVTVGQPVMGQVVGGPVIVQSNDKMGGIR